MLKDKSMYILLDDKNLLRTNSVNTKIRRQFMYSFYLFMNSFNCYLELPNSMEQ